MTAPKLRLVYKFIQSIKDRKVGLEFLSEYGLFVAKAITIVVSLLFIIGAAAQLGKQKGPTGSVGQIEVKKLNDIYDEYKSQLTEQVLSSDAQKIAKKEQKKADKQAKKAAKQDSKKESSDSTDSQKPVVYVVDFEGDVKASAVENLREEVTAILLVAKKGDEVVINLESPGGMVHTYGLAASQLMRIRQAGITLTICVDKVAASGGYLMACVGHKILAAPFAIIGSVGVLAQIPNFHRALKKFDVDYDIMTAGEHKAPVSMFGEITDKGKAKLQEELEQTHVLFKRFITDNRPQVPVDEIATGEVWYGQEAIKHQLVDDIQTLDDYLLASSKEKELFSVAFTHKKTVAEKLGVAMQAGVSGAWLALMNKDQDTRVQNSLR